MVLRSFMAVLLFLSFLMGCTTPLRPIPRDIASLNASGGMIGIWFLQGTSSVHGPYNGELELRPAGDGTYNVIRIVTYINYFYDGLKVQEVWQGKAVAAEDTLTISYDLRQGEFITKTGDLTKTPKDLQTRLTINMRFFPTPSGLEAKFSDKRASEYSEWITTKRPLEAQPLWGDERKYLSEVAPALPAAEKKKVQSAQRILNYGKDPFVQSYKNRTEFKNTRAQAVQDRTDLSFYKSQPNVLRLVNKVTDAATIAETVLKRNAYYPSLEDKAARYDETTSQKNFSALNLIVIRKGSTESDLLPDMLDTDAVFTTGLYMASQAMRYQVTKSAEALKNIQRALQGIQTAVEISQDSAMIASAVAPVPAGKEIPPRWFAGTGPRANLMWSAENQELSILGMLHGLVAAAVSVPENQSDIQRALREVITLLQKKSPSTWSGPNRGVLSGLAMLLLKENATASIFNATKPPAKGFYWAGNADWTREFSTLLEAVDFLTLAKAMKNSEKEAQWRTFLLSEYQIYASARRPLRILATRYFAPDFMKYKETDLSWALQKLEEVPYPRMQDALTIDHSGDPRWVVSPIPRNYWSVTDKNRQSVQSYYQGLNEVPLFELLGYTSRFIWKESAFQYRMVSPGKVEATGVDYLYAYWLAKAAGAVNNP